MILDKKTLWSTGFSEIKYSFIRVRCIWNIYAVYSNTLIWFSGYDSTGSVLISPVPHQMMSYMNVGTLSRTELQLLNQLHCRARDDTEPSSRRATGGTGEPFPRNQIPWCWHTRAIGTKGAPTRRESRGEWNQCIDHTVNDRVHRYFIFTKRWLKFLVIMQ